MKINIENIVIDICVTVVIIAILITVAFLISQSPEMAAAGRA